MEVLGQTAQSLFTWIKVFFDSLLTDWGIIGFAILAFFIVPRVENFIRRMFR